MTPEEIADEFCLTWGFSTERTEALAEIIRASRREAIEQAAKVAEQKAKRAKAEYDGDEYGCGCIACAEAIASLIRRLSSKGE